MVLIFLTQISFLFLLTRFIRPRSVWTQIFSTTNLQLMRKCSSAVYRKISDISRTLPSYLRVVHLCSKIQKHLANRSEMRAKMDYNWEDYPDCPRQVEIITGKYRCRFLVAWSGKLFCQKLTATQNCLLVYGICILFLILCTYNRIAETNTSCLSQKLNLLRKTSE
jgi:hypothetical protein